MQPQKVSPWVAESPVYRRRYATHPARDRSRKLLFYMDTGQWVGSPGSSPRGETDPDIDFYEFMEQTVPYACMSAQSFIKSRAAKRSG